VRLLIFIANLPIGAEIPDRAGDILGPATVSPLSTAAAALAIASPICYKNTTTPSVMANVRS